MSLKNLIINPIAVQNPKETEFYNNSAKMENTATASAKTDENSKIVKESYENKKPLKNDVLKIAQESKMIEENPKSTIEIIENKYVKCESATNSANYEVKRCDEHITQANSCYLGKVSCY